MVGVGGTARSFDLFSDIVIRRDGFFLTRERDTEVIHNDRRALASERFTNFATNSASAASYSGNFPFQMTSHIRLLPERAPLLASFIINSAYSAKAPDSPSVHAVRIWRINLDRDCAVQFVSRLE